MRYYIIDTTLSNQNQAFNTVQEVVQHLEGTVQRKFKLTRKQYMQNLIDLGYGYDDDGGLTFTASLSEYFNIGVIQDGGRYVRTNIHETDRNGRYRTEQGD